MVIDNTKTLWKCPYCGEEYDNFDDANDCAIDCADVDDPEELVVTKYECAMCHKVFEEYDEAEVCEMKHSNDEDKYWVRFQEIESMKRLEEAANHPNQTKIENYK